MLKAKNPKNKEVRKIPRFLYDEEGNAYEMIYESHRDGFNLCTFRLNKKDYEVD